LQELKKIKMLNRYAVLIIPGGKRFNICWWRDRIDQKQNRLSFHRHGSPAASGGFCASLYVPSNFARSRFTITDQVFGFWNITIFASPSEWY
jgi:hypothetical protein